METEVAPKLVKLGGRKIKVVKSGLDEAEVSVYIEELISERDALLKRQESLTSLAKLYERTVIEADNLAKEIQKEVMEKSQHEANALMMKAHETAKDIVERQIVEAQNVIKQQVKTIKTQVAEQLGVALKEQIKVVQSTIRDTARVLSETLTEQAAKLDNIEDSFQIDLEKTTPETIPAPVEKVIIETENNVADENTNNSLDENVIEMDILPPRDQDEIDAIEAELKTIPEIKSTELLSLIDKSVLKIKAEKPFDLITFLQSNPHIYQAEEIVKDGRKSIAVTLMAKARLDQENHSVNHKIASMLSR